MLSWSRVMIFELSTYCNKLFSGIIKWVSLATVYSNTMYWPASAGWGGIANMLSKYFQHLSTIFIEYIPVYIDRQK